MLIKELQEVCFVSYLSVFAKYFKWQLENRFHWNQMCMLL